MNEPFALTVVNIVCTVVIGIFAFVFRRALNDYDSLEGLVRKIDKRVAILYDRDRRSRAYDSPPEAEEGWPES